VVVEESDSPAAMAGDAPETSATATALTKSGLMDFFMIFPFDHWNADLRKNLMSKLVKFM
jgi:hypothetical protein